MIDTNFRITNENQIKITREQYRALKTADRESIDNFLSALYAKGQQNRKTAAEQG